MRRKEIENLRQQIKHTKERIGDAGFALERGDFHQEEARTRTKNKRRREDIARKQNEVLDVEEL